MKLCTPAADKKYKIHWSFHAKDSQTYIKRTSINWSPSIKQSLNKLPEIISFNYCKSDLY